MATCSACGAFDFMPGGGACALCCGIDTMRVDPTDIKATVPQALITAPTLDPNDLYRSDFVKPLSRPSTASPMQPPADSGQGLAEAQAFVDDLRRQGHAFWVVRRWSVAGLLQVVNLADPEDCRMLNPGEYDLLMAECRAANSRPLPVPMQPWELEKLEESAKQVLAALTSGRYCQGFGEALLQNLKGWSGATAWAQAEEKRIAAFVAADDAESRDELRRWTEDSLISTLREVHKEVHRGQMAGTAPGSGSASSSTRAYNNVLSMAENAEDAELQAALEISLAEAGEDDVARETDAELAVENAVEEAAESVAGGVRSDKAFASRDVTCQSPSLEGCESSQVVCGHACDLGTGRCCSCAPRLLGSRTAARLVAWSRGTCTGFAEGFHGHRRFFCTACACVREAHANPGDILMELPVRLPFGGMLMRSPLAQADAKIVELSAEALAAFSEACGNDPPAVVDIVSGASSLRSWAIWESDAGDGDPPGTLSRFASSQSWVLVES